jgi:hypothetical protein
MSQRKTSARSFVEQGREMDTFLRQLGVSFGFKRKWRVFPLMRDPDYRGVFSAHLTGEDCRFATDAMEKGI